MALLNHTGSNQQSFETKEKILHDFKGWGSGHFACENAAVSVVGLDKFDAAAVLVLDRWEVLPVVRDPSSAVVIVVVVQEGAELLILLRVAVHVVVAHVVPAVHVVEAHVVVAAHHVVVAHHHAVIAVVSSHHLCIQLIFERLLVDQVSTHTADKVATHHAIHGQRIDGSPPIIHAHGHT